MSEQYSVERYDQKPRGRVRKIWCVTGDFDVTLYQRKKDDFAVQYGKQVDDHLTYAEAAAKFGEAVMHLLALDGRITQ